jgi:hypothetical protein
MSKVHDRSRSILWMLALLAAACGGGAPPGDDPEAIREQLADKGVLEVAKETGEAEYEAPADGKLTEAQIEMFLRVQERAKKIQQVAVSSLEEKTEAGSAAGEKVGFTEALGALRDAGNVATAGLRAAQELGYNPKEYQWVQSTVLTTYAERRQQEVMEQAGAYKEQFLATLKAQRDALPEDQRAEVDRGLEEMTANFEEAEQQAAERAQDPGFAHNRLLVERHRAEIEAAFLPMERAMLGLGGAPPPAGR